MEQSREWGKVNRRTALGVAGLGLMGLAVGCNGEESEGESAQEGRSGASLDPSSQKYYLVSGNIGDPFYRDVRDGFAAAEEEFGFSSEVRGTQNTDISVIVSQIQALIAQPDTSGLMLPNLDPEAYEPIFREANENGIPIVNYLNDFVAPRISYVGQSITIQAQGGARILGERMEGSGKVGYMAQLIQQDLVKKGQVFASTLESEFSDIEYVGAQTYDGSPEDGLRVFNALLGRHPDLTGLYWGDGSGGAIAQSIQSASSDIQLLLTDVVGPSVEAVEQGYAFATFGPSQFDVAFYAPQLLYMWNAGYRVPDPVIIPLTVVDEDSVAEFLENPESHGDEVTGEPSSIVN